MDLLGVKISIQSYFQASTNWHIIRILANLMNRDAKSNIVGLMQAATSSKCEKRRYFRLSLRLPMEYSFPESSRQRLAYTVDLCEGGLLMHTQDKLEIGQDLKIKFYYYSGVQIDCVEALGKVIRVDGEGKTGKEYRCAVKLLGLSSNFLRKFRKFLETLY